MTDVGKTASDAAPRCARGRHDTAARRRRQMEASMATRQARRGARAQESTGEPKTGLIMLQKSLSRSARVNL
jgi:hypothetical protein